MPDSGERMESLGGGLHAIVSKEHTFGVDFILLAHFSSPKNGQKLCDLGTGCGIIPLLWCRSGGSFQIDAFEIRHEAAELAKKAVRLNSLDIKIYEQDLRLIAPSFSGGYDLVVCNPPYFRSGGGLVSRGDAQALARHETSCTLKDVIKTAKRLLKPGGRFCVCHRPERLADLLTMMRAQGLEPKRMRLAQQNSFSKPFLTLIEGRRGGRPGMDVLPVLTAENGGAVSDEMRLIYGEYRE